MKILAFVPLVLVLAGCTGGHYYTVEQGTVSISLYKTDANTVYFASSLDNYMLHRAERVGQGIWEIEVPATNEFRYFYVVDGEFYIPPCRMTETDDFGSENCFYVPGL